jgi:hypothetical protein
MSIQFRSHRGTLEESLKTICKVNSKTELATHISEELGLFINPHNLTIKWYCADNRVGWGTCYIVTIPELGVLGFTNGPLDN